MEKIIVAIVAVASVAAAYLFGRKSGSGGNDRQRDLRGAFSDLREAAHEVEDAGDRTSRAADEIRDVDDSLVDTVSITRSSRKDDLIGELCKRTGERSLNSRELPPLI